MTRLLRIPLLLAAGGAALWLALFALIPLLGGLGMLWLWLDAGATVPGEMWRRLLLYYPAVPVASPWLIARLLTALRRGLYG